MASSNLSNVALISLLKQYGVRRLVLSSGMRNLPFVSRVEVDSDFQCYSVIDERNAAFFGMGLAQQSGEPVAIACTSGTAASNYLTGLTEAFYSHVPLVAITFDRSPYMLNQLETQKIDQVDIFDSVVKRSVTLPLVKDEEDLWYAERLINEALISLYRHGVGPVHINVPLIGDTNDLNEAADAMVKRGGARRIRYVARDGAFAEEVERLRQCKRILVVAGQGAPNKFLSKALSRFVSATGAAVLLDNLANVSCPLEVMAEPTIKALNGRSVKPLVPEVLITFGNNFQERIKQIFGAHAGEYEHWSIEPTGEVKDVFRCQSAIFEYEPEEFFSRMADDICGSESNMSYYEDWKAVEAAAVLPEMPFTNFSVIGAFAHSVPTDSIVHTSILNCTRILQFFRLDPSIAVYGNVNAFGIDGCLPTLVGQAAVSDKLAFMIIGDLSFFYAMNAIGIKHLGKNVRVLMVNNGGGAEFHIQPDSDARPSIDWHIGAAHERKAGAWAQAMGFEYHAVENEAELDVAMARLIDPDANHPVFVEVFTDLGLDGRNCLNAYRELEKAVAPVVERLLSR